MPAEEIEYFEKELSRAEAKLTEIYTLISRGVIRLYGRDGQRGFTNVKKSEMDSDDLELSKLAYLAEGLERQIPQLKDILEAEKNALKSMEERT